MIQAHIFYSGKIQGVGFRYTVKSFAKECSVVGWVKNLENGKVELVAEGEEKQINKLCQLVEEQFEGFIVDKKMTTERPQGKFTNFQVIY